MDDLDFLLKRANALTDEAGNTPNAAQRLTLLAQAAECWLHINRTLKKLLPAP